MDERTLRSGCSTSGRELRHLTAGISRDLCDSLEGVDSPKERCFGALHNVHHMLNNLRMITSWGLTKQQQKAVLFTFPTLIKRRTRHLESMRERFFHFQPPHQVEQNLANCMDKLSLSCDDLVEMLIKEPKLLGYNYIAVIRRRIRWMMKKLGLDKEFVARHVLVVCPDLLLRSWIDRYELMLANPKILLRTDLYDMHDELMQFKDQVGIDYL